MVWCKFCLDFRFSTSCKCFYSFCVAMLASFSYYFAYSSVYCFLIDIMEIILSNFNMNFMFLYKYIMGMFYRWSRLEPISCVSHDQWNAHKRATSVPIGAREPANHNKDCPDDTEDVFVWLPTDNGGWIRCIRILETAIIARQAEVSL